MTIIQCLKNRHGDAGGGSNDNIHLYPFDDFFGGIQRKWNEKSNGYENGNSNGHRNGIRGQDAPKDTPITRIAQGYETSTFKG